VLQAQGLAPAKLRAEHEAKAPMCEAELVGYGQLGTHACRTLTSPGRVHSGHTWVSPGIVTGRTVLLHRSPVFTVGEGKDTVYFGFDRVEAGFAIVDPETGARTELRSHPKQAFGARGDSGGPLFFTTPGGLEVAGIFSGSLLQRVAVGDAEEDEMVNPTWSAHPGALRQGQDAFSEAMRVNRHLSEENEIKNQLANGGTIVTMIWSPGSHVSELNCLFFIN
jgi:hypothetical protein